jgi:hypothetical protein
MMASLKRRPNIATISAARDPLWPEKWLWLAWAVHIPGMQTTRKTLARGHAGSEAEALAAAGAAVPEGKEPLSNPALAAARARLHLRVLRANAALRQLRAKEDAIAARRPVPRALVVLGLGAKATAAEVNAAYRARAFELHPDRGGSHARMVALNNARDAALAAVAQRRPSG